MNSLQLINYHADDCSYPLSLTEILDEAFKYEIMSGLFLRLVNDEVVDARYSTDISIALVASRVRFKEDMECERIYIKLGTKSEVIYCLSLIIHKYQPVCCNRLRSGEINAPIQKRNLRPWSDSCVMKLSDLVKYSFQYIRCQGVYFLLMGDVVQYVGETIDVSVRLSQHVKARDKVFDRVSVIYCCEQSNLKILESFYVCKFNPPQQGRRKDGELFSTGSMIDSLGNLIEDEIVIERYIADYNLWRI